MKNLLVISFFGLLSAPAFAGEFYECSGFADVEEYRVGIDLDRNEAAFFDNDTTSVMTLVSSKVLQSLPPQIQLIFEGPDAGSPNKNLRLWFNKTRLHAVLANVDAAGEVYKIGEADCELSEPWGL